MKKTLELAGIPVEIELKYPDAILTFAPYIKDRIPCASVCISQTELEAARNQYEPGASDLYVEYMELSLKVSEALLPFNRVIFHGTAFFWQGKAWIFAAISGTGKTTQYLHWKELYGEDVQIICGDKPILFFDNRSIAVHPSPWNGKEGMGQQVSAPLGGIILLRQSVENRIRKINKTEASGPLFLQFLFSRKTTEDVYTVARLEEQLLNRTPVWLLENCGDAESAVLCHDTLMETLT